MAALSRDAVVVDLGSGVIKCGFAGQNKPQCVYSAVIGRPKYPRAMPGGELIGDIFFGPKVEEHRGSLRLSHPTSHGHVESWEDATQLWQYGFERQNLGVDARDQPLLLTEAPMTPRAEKEAMASAWFETFRVPALHFAGTGTLALYACGRTTGVVVECGDGLSTVTPVYEGFAVPHAVSRVDLGGRDVTAQLLWNLRKSGHAFHTTAEAESIRLMKETHGYISTNPVADETAVRDGTHVSVEYMLPDGQKLSLGPERFRCGELIFNPRLVGLEHPGMHENVHASIMKTDLEMRSKLLGNMLLAGGTTAMKGFGERLLTEMRKLTPPGTKIKIFAPADRKIFPWVGGSILASLSTFRTLCVTSAQWEEEGARVLHRYATM